MNKSWKKYQLKAGDEGFNQYIAFGLRSGVPLEIKTKA